MLLIPLGCAPSVDDTIVSDSHDATTPPVDYNNFGEGFMLDHCQACHASTSASRQDAPAEVTFDTVEQVWAWQPRILVRPTGTDPDMPPSGGVVTAAVRLDGEPGSQRAGEEDHGNSAVPRL